MAKVYATGKRKTAIAKVWLSNGSGKLVVNDMTLNEWLGGHEAIKKKVLQPSCANQARKVRRYCG